MNKLIDIILAHPAQSLMLTAWAFTAFATSLPDPASMAGKPFGLIVYEVFRSFVRALLPLAERRIAQPQATVGPVTNSDVTVLTK